MIYNIIDILGIAFLVLLIATGAIMVLSIVSGLWNHVDGVFYVRHVSEDHDDWQLKYNGKLKDIKDGAKVTFLVKEIPNEDWEWFDLSEGGDQNDK